MSHKQLKCMSVIKIILISEFKSVDLYNIDKLLYRPIYLAKVINNNLQINRRMYFYI